MGLYSDAILRQMGQIGKPIRATSRTVGMPTTSTSKTTVKPPGPAIDIMQLLMMLIFSGAFKQKPGETLGTTPTPAPRDLSALPPQPPTMPPTPYPTTGMGAGGMGGTGDLAALMKLLMGIPGMGGIPGT